MKILGIIPARYNSTRFPGKPLADIKGKSMIMHVYERAKKAQKLDSLVVATDDDRIFDHVEKHGGEVMMTGDKHPTGTDRCQEVIRKLDAPLDVVINIQGDEPFIDPAQIDRLAALFDDPGVEIGTLCTLIHNPATLQNTNAVKVVFNHQNEALYFSRLPIPFYRGEDQENRLEHHAYYQHIGLYGYRIEMLEEISKLKISDLEKAESLEQLRWLENGMKIKLAISEEPSHAIDTPEDLQELITRI